MRRRTVKHDIDLAEPASPDGEAGRRARGPCARTPAGRGVPAQCPDRGDDAAPQVTAQ